MPTITLYFKKCSRCGYQITLESVPKARVHEVLRSHGWERIRGQWHCAKCSDILFWRFRMVLIVIVCLLLAVVLGARFLG